MNLERWKQIDDLFDAVIDLPEDEQEEFLSNRCKDDEALKKDVLILLESEKKAKTFIEKPAINLMAEAIGEENTTLVDSIGIGTEIGIYRIETILGRGGMGEVFLAHDNKLNRKVALKILPREYLDDTERRIRFENEARAISVLNHPNIVTIHDFGVENDINYIATEFVAGKTVRELIDSDLELKDSLSIIRQATDALSAAHEAGIIHRDIKPENIMVRPDGYVKVLDFGLAKLVENYDEHPQDFAGTIKGTIMGTPAYMSPEQASGTKVDNRTDLWSLGVVFYEMLTGKNPFKKESRQATLQAILADDPELPSSLNPEIPRELDQILMKTLEKDSDLSYQTSSGLGVDLKRVKRDIDSSPSWNGKAADIEQRNGWVKPLSLGLLSIGIVGSIIWLATSYFVNKTPSDANLWKSAQNTQLTESPGGKNYPSLAPDGQSFIYVARVDGNSEILWQRVGGKNAVNLTKTDSGESMPAFSPDGKLIAFRSGQNGVGIYLMESTGENVRRIADIGYHPSWSPDGKKIVISDIPSDVPTGHTLPKSSLWIIDIETTKRKKLEIKGDAIQPSWSPNGKRIAYWFVKEGKLGDIATIPADGGKPVVAVDNVATDWNPLWSPDGKYIYFISDRSGNMNIWRVPIDEDTGVTTGEAESVPAPAKFTRHLTFSRDGKRLAYIRTEGKSNLQSLNFDPITEKVEKPASWVTTGNRHVSSPDLSPDGEEYVAREPGFQQEDLVIYDRNGAKKRYLTKDKFTERTPRWSPNGKRIYFHSNRSGKYQIWSVNPDGTDRKQITFGKKFGIMHAVFAPDGSRMIYSELADERTESPFMIDLSKDWDQQSPQPLSPEPEFADGFRAFSWSPEGDRILFMYYGGPNRKVAIGVYDLKTQLSEKVVDHGVFPVWLNDSKRFLFRLSGEIFLSDTVTKKVRSLYKPTRYQLSNINISKDNKLIFFRYVENETDIWLLDASEQK